MIRVVWILLTLGIVAFWTVMNTALLERELRYRNLDNYNRGVTEFLGNELQRERWMGIYRGQKKIGYTGFTLTKVFEDTGVRHQMEIESQFNFEFFGKGRKIRVQGNATADIRMLPEQLAIDVDIDGGNIHLTGRREGNFLLLAAEAGGRKILEQSLPLRELFLSDGLAPTPPVAGFEVGETYTLPIFDPIFQTTGMATVTVKERASRALGGFKLDCYHLETQFRDMTYQTWMTEDGEVVRQEIPAPLNLTLVREEREAARRLPPPPR